MKGGSIGIADTASETYRRVDLAGATDQCRHGGGGSGCGNSGGSGGSGSIASEINDTLVLWRIERLEATYEFLAGDTDRRVETTS